MSIVSEALEKLVQLQKLDIEIASARKVIAEIPVRKSALSAALAEKKRILEEEKKKTQKLTLDLKNKNAELEASEQAVKKHTGELNTVKTNQAYKALLDEIESAKKQSSEIEDEIIKILDAIEKENAGAATRAADLKQLESDCAAGIKTLDAEGAALEARLAEKKLSRENMASGVPKKFLDVYERMLANKNGIAVAPVEGSGCGGCHMKLSIQNVNELARVYSDDSRSVELVCCENCSRILFFEGRPAV